LLKNRPEFQSNPAVGWYLPSRDIPSGRGLREYQVGVKVVNLLVGHHALKAALGHYRRDGFGMPSVVDEVFYDLDVFAVGEVNKIKRRAATIIYYHQDSHLILTSFLPENASE
jgi:hypothetical protein